MKLILPYIFLLLSILQCSAHASELIKVSRADTKDIIQFYFTFDVTPEFTSIRSDRRIDLEFFKTTRASSVALGEPDNDIVKILPRPGTDRYTLSLFFRYSPQHYTITRSADGKLVFEVLLGNEYSKSYKNLADNLKGLTVLERTSNDSLNPLLTSPYAKNWISFFSLYESPLKIDVPINFSLPPFPVIGLLPPGEKENLSIIDTEMFELADKNLWDELGEKLLNLIEATQDEETKKQLALTYGEVLSRSGKFEDAYRQLYLLKEQYSDELLGTYANYLLIQLRAVHENPYIGDSCYRAMESSISNTLPLAPYLLLSQIETAFATGNHERLNHLLLRDDVALPETIKEIIEIHQGDYWYIINQPAKARAAYKLQSDSPVLQTLPFSLGNFCNVNYDGKMFEEAATCYETLSTFAFDKALLGLIDYRKNMSKLRTGDETSLIDNFSFIATTYPHTEAGLKAEIKRNDLLFLKNKTWGRQAAENYGTIAKEAKSRDIREEALFKQALIQALLGEPTMSIKLLQQYLREFLTGDVRISAQALLIDLLPGEIKRLVDSNEYMQPLVLAKQNKEFFQNKWIDSKFLVEIAEAYNRIGIYDEAQKLYLYLIGVMPADQQEDFFLPMIQATFDHGDYQLVEDYAAQYSYNYPKGHYTTEILLFRLRSLLADERLSDALLLLPDPLPENTDFYRLAASLFYRTDNFQKCIIVSKKLILMKVLLTEKEQYIYADCLYRTDQFEEAEQLFMAVTQESDFYQQSLYRLAELARKKGNEKKALSLFAKIVETEKNNLWKRYAERELQFAKEASRN